MHKANIIIKEKIVKCRRLSPAAFVELSDCQKCDNHKGFELVMKGQNGLLPDVEDIMCALPTRVRIDNRVQEVTE